jgi:pimeloyl-ACP methyl ester carboxylesterase
MWHRTRPALSSSYRKIALDNRSTGESVVPPGPYSIALMASDTAAVLDAASVPSTHVFGVSMGDMIAQEFAVQCPGRVQSLILGCTAAGGPNAKRAKPDAVEMLKAACQMSRNKQPSRRATRLAQTRQSSVFDRSARGRAKSDLRIPGRATGRCKRRRREALSPWNSYPTAGLKPIRRSAASFLQSI